MTHVKSVSTAQGRIKKQIRRAFCRLRPPQTSWPGPSYGASYSRLRGQLPLMLPDAMQFYLPHIMCDLIDRHSRGPFAMQDEDLVIFGLNVPSRHRRIGADSKTEERQEYEDQKKEACYKKRQFEHFTSAQASAVAAWLQLAMEWECLQAYQDELKKALRYWRKRAGVSLR